MQKAVSETKALDVFQRDSKAEPSPPSGGKAEDTNLRSIINTTLLILWLLSCY